MCGNVCGVFLVFSYGLFFGYVSLRVVESSCQLRQRPLKQDKKTHTHTKPRQNQDDQHLSKTKQQKATKYHAPYPTNPNPTSHPLPPPHTRLTAEARV